MPSDRFFAYVERLVTYEGALQAKVRAEMMADSQESVRTRPSPRKTAPVHDSRNSRDVVEYADDGTRILNGVAVNDQDIPLWVTRLPGYNPDNCVMLPADPKLLSATPAFSDRFSYAQVGPSDGSG